MGPERNRKMSDEKAAAEFGTARIDLKAAEADAEKLAKGLDAIASRLTNRPEQIMFEDDMIVVRSDQRGGRSTLVKFSAMDVEKLRAIVDRVTEAKNTISSLEPRMREMGLID